MILMSPILLALSGDSRMPCNGDPLRSATLPREDHERHRRGRVHLRDGGDLGVPPRPTGRDRSDKGPRPKKVPT